MRTVVVLSLLACSLIAACADPAPPADTAAKTAAEKPAEPPPFTVDKAKLQAFAPLPEVFGDPAALTDAKVQLGRTLFHDLRFSRAQDVSCNSCHTLEKFGVDGQPMSTGFKGQKGGRNSPTVLNAAGHFVQFWDGRSPDVEDQAKGPVLNPVEMAMKSDKDVVVMLKSIPGYGPLFTAAFPGDKDPVSWDNFAKAVGAFERKLSTPAKFDAYLKGDEKALSDDEKKGLVAFIDTGCTACHMGALLGGSMYQKAGLVKPWPTDKDAGRFGVTKNEAEKFFFKVPSLRNVEKTAPYFHDGSVASLEEATKMMGRHQLGKELTDAETATIVTFLKTLTGELPKDLIAVPILPDSGPKTPKPVKS